ncbi:MAG: putative lipase [Pirellulales bacterium]|nr:putative lipase [Pirellulales bacterium]
MQRARTNWITILLLEGLFLLLLSYSQAHAKQGFFGIGAKTLGGRMLFSDEVVYQGWRVQKSAVVGHYRLLTPDDRRHTFGTLEHCLETLEKVKVEKKLPPLPKEVVIVVHGLGASRQWMSSLSEYLEEEGNLKVVNVGYPSTMGEIGEHAGSLASVIQHLDGVEQISFVAHSMGNIVIRHCLNDLASLPASAQPQITYGRFVMVAPPNHGATAADKFANNKLAQAFGGEAVQQLAPSKGWPTLEQRLATPDFEFGILVGGRGDDEGYLDGIPGDDDMLLSVETSKLAGASDFAQVKGIHQTLPKNEQVQQYTLRFLQTGAFMPSGRRYPIAAVEDPATPR